MLEGALRTFSISEAPGAPKHLPALPSLVLPWPFALWGSRCTKGPQQRPCLDPC